MEKSLIDIIKPFHLLYRKREMGITLTYEEQKMLSLYDSWTEYSPKQLLLNNNTSNIKLSDLIKFLNE